MLVLTRKPKEEIRIGNGVTITILRVKGQSVRIGIDAPNDVRIVRGELEPKTEESASAEASNPAKDVDSKSPVASQTVDPGAKQIAPVDSKYRYRCDQSHQLSSPSAPCSSRMSGSRRQSTLKALVARNRAIANSSNPPTASGNGSPQ